METDASHSQHSGCFAGCTLTVRYPGSADAPDLERASEVLREALPGVGLRFEPWRAWMAVEAEGSASDGTVPRGFNGPIESASAHAILEIAREALRKLQ
ncbi:MAG: hypothetical protein M3463_12550 [Verrucomicrobiota bacterium]|nr:hypothetical protein [Verrucomicrobiota bacterium]